MPELLLPRVSGALLTRRALRHRARPRRTPRPVLCASSCTATRHIDSAHRYRGRQEEWASPAAAAERYLRVRQWLDRHHPELGAANTLPQMEWTRAMPSAARRRKRVRECRDEAGSLSCVFDAPRTVTSQSPSSKARLSVAAECRTRIHYHYGVSRSKREMPQVPAKRPMALRYNCWPYCAPRRSSMVFKVWKMM